MEGNPQAVRGGPLSEADGATLTTDRDDDHGGGIGGRRGEGDAQLGVPQQQGDQGSAPVIQRRRSRTDAATGGTLPMRIPVPADNWSRPSDYMTSSSASASASAMMDTTTAVGGISRVNNSGYYAAGVAGGYPNNNGGVATASAAVGGGSGIKLLQFGGPAAAPSTEAVANNDGPTPRRGRASTTTSTWATWAASSASASTDTTADTTSSTTTAGAQGHVPHFVAPSSYLRLRPKTSTRSAMAPSEPKPLSPLDKDQLQGLNAIRDFLKVRTSYDVLPLSFRLIVLDTDLLIKKSLNILIQNSIVSAPLWDSRTARFAGILTSTDFINVIQYYCQYPDEISKLEQFRLNSLRDIEKAIGAVPIETVSVHPSRPLFEACRRMLKTRARRIPLVDVDSETNKEMVVSVITQYRILKFIAVNNEHNTVLLKKTVRDIGLGTYSKLATARMSSSVLDVVHLMVDHNISCIPIVDNENRVLNVFEAVDVIPCIKGGMYEELDASVGEALCKRPDESPGIYTCGENDRMDSIFDTIRKSRVHRLIVVDDDNKLKGIISLSDVLKYVLLSGVEDTSNWS